MIGSSRNPRLEHVKPKQYLTKEEKEALLAETERKKKFVHDFKGLVDGTNFSVGTEDPNFDRKEVATIDNPNYEMTIVSPWPHKNTSTLKMKYGDQSSYARPQPHSVTMDINRMDAATLQMTERPKFLAHLKKGSLKFPSSSTREHSQPERSLAYKKVLPYV